MDRIADRWSACQPFAVLPMVATPDTGPGLSKRPR